MTIFNKLIHFAGHRNFLLSLALILGLVLGKNTWILPDISVYVLAVVMTLAMSGFSFSVFRKPVEASKMTGLAFLLNYIVFGGVLLLTAHLIAPGSELWLGCVLLAASPPGPSVVPFTAIMKGNINLAVIGLAALHLLALFFAPLILIMLTGNNLIDPKIIVVILAKTIIAPLIFSRPLRNRHILPHVEKIRGKLINIGFFLIIVPIVGQSAHVMILNPALICQSMLIFAVTMFLSALVFHIMATKIGMKTESIIASVFFLTTKSSAFAAVVVFALNEETAGIPAAVHAFFVTIFFIGYSALKTGKNKI